VNGDLNWQGVPLSKNPCDLWMMVELMQRLEPSVILETGTNYGGSAIFFADIMKTLGLECTVITIDYNPKWAIEPTTRGIVSLVGLSTDPGIVQSVRDTIQGVLQKNPGHVLVVLDSDHSEANVYEELLAYSPLVTIGSYIVCEDTNVNGHPSAPSHGPGPWEAVLRFLAGTSSFVVDQDCQRFLLTFNPNGWLKRVS